MYCMGGQKGRMRGEWQVGGVQQSGKVGGRKQDSQVWGTGKSGEKCCNIS